MRVVKTHNKTMNVWALCVLDLATLGPFWQRYLEKKEDIYFQRRGINGGVGVRR